MRYYLLLLATSMLWAGNFVAGKFVVGHANALVLTELRYGMAVVCLLPIIWFKERKLVPPLRAVPALILMGLFGAALFNLFMFWALERTTADNSSLISALNPISIAVVSFFILKEKLTLRQIAAMLLSLVGVIIVISHGQWQRVVQFHFNMGDIYMIVAVVIWGFYSVAGKYAMRQVSPLMSTLWSGLFGVVLLLPFSVSDFQITNATFDFWVALLYGGIGATVLAMLFWNIGVQKVGGTRSGIFLNFNPIFTAILAYFVLDEKVAAPQWIGSAVVIAGVLLFTIKGRSSKRSIRHMPDIKPNSSAAVTISSVQGRSPDV